ncbi:YggT family protein [Collinsella tanakaei]|nr:YggT family protein [Collinsella tanakaei]MDM8245271.1 YggT family protein [Collinsella tanakaei]
MTIYTLVQAISTLVGFYELLIVIYCLLSWFPMRQGGIVYDFAVVLDRLVGPYLNFFRRIIPPMGGIDFSPVVALIALSLAERLVFNIIL